MKRSIALESAAERGSPARGCLAYARLVKAANLALRFFLEIAALAALSYGGFHAGSSDVVQWLLGIGLPLLAAVVWGLFIAPRARYRVSDPIWIALQVVVFGAATAALLTAGQTTPAIVFVALLIVNAVLMIILDQDRDSMGMMTEEVDR